MGRMADPHPHLPVGRGRCTTIRWDGLRRTRMIMVPMRMTITMTMEVLLRVGLRMALRMALRCGIAGVCGAPGNHDLAARRAVAMLRQQQVARYRQRLGE